MDTDTNNISLKRKECEPDTNTTTPTIVETNTKVDQGDKKRIKNQLSSDTTTTTTTTTTTSKSSSNDINSDKQQQQQQTKKPFFKGKFIYGNYKHYYKYRHEHADQEDLRFQVLNKDLFKGKRCLDIGCNSGVVTLKIASDFEPSYIKGIDIDLDLIKQANTLLRNERTKLYNLKHNIKDNINKNNDNNKETNNNDMQNDDSDIEMKSNENGNQQQQKEQQSTSSSSSSSTSTTNNQQQPFIPISFKYIKFDESKKNTNNNSNSKSLQQQQYKEMNRKLYNEGILSNVAFYQQNFMEDNKHDKVGSYDVIMALSITKWIHLNWGDQGLKDFFKKIYKLLAKGGIFILEPQKFRGYSKRKGLSKEMIENYNNIRFKPEEFTDFLVKEVGFTSCEQLESIQGVTARGFKRPLYKLIK